MDKVKVLIDRFMYLLNEGLSANIFVKLSLSNHKGEDKTLKNIYVKRIVIKNQEKLQLVYRYQTKDITKNFDLQEAKDIIKSALGKDFYAATLFTIEHDYNLQVASKGKANITTQKPQYTKLPEENHDKKKKYILHTPENSYLYDLKITDNKANVLPNSQDKYKQINHYIELLSPLFKSMDENAKIKVADMGSGKGYLTFALYDYLKNQLHLDAEVIGVELRKELVNFCNEIAKKNAFSDLKFVESAINSYDYRDIDMLIALHACDTATDDAIASGIKAGAKYIVVAPCCHKQLRRELEKSKPENKLNFMTKHGVFLERHAEMLTDGIRALILEYFGYKTKVFEFISGAHTPKNVMITGMKATVSAENQEKIKKQLLETKQYFGIEYHYLEKLVL